VTRTRGELPVRPVVVRPRLSELLARRHIARVTTVIAAGGAGKTTALSQACDVAEPDIDIWHSCTSGDNDTDRFVARLTESLVSALGGSAPRTLAVSGIADLVLAASPRQVCLIIDDCHLLLRPDVISNLVDELPANGHVLLSGRTVPPVELSRIEAQGRLAEISQDDLLLTGDEVLDFAALRGVDASVLAGADGWPAFVELATSGTSTSSRRYLSELTVAGLDHDRKRRLAIFHSVGGGDDEVARLATNISLDELITGLPLVRRSEHGARLHDLWGDLLDEPPSEERHRAAVAVAGVMRSRGNYDRAIDLSAQVEDWLDVLESIGAACMDGVDGGLRLAQLERWSSLLPSESASSSIGLLAQGLVEREHDPTGIAMRDAMNSAADLFRAEGRPDLELVALTQLGYSARIRVEAETIRTIQSKIRTLSEAHRPARPFVDVCDAWLALVEGKPDQLLLAADRLRSVELPLVWRTTVNHLHAHALFNTGRPAEALDIVPRSITDLPVPIPGALVTEIQCHWYAGYPDRALEMGTPGGDDRYGARDRFIAWIWHAVMTSYAGQTRAAREALARASQSLGSSPGPLLQGQLAGIEALVLLAEGDDAAARGVLSEILELVPLGSGIGEQLLRGHVAVVYTLLATTREAWDGLDLGPSIAQNRVLARAFVSAREEADFKAIAVLDWPEPGIVATAFPVEWAIEFALYGVLSGQVNAETTVEWLCEKWGQPARDALASHASSPQLGEITSTILSRTPLPPDRRSELQVLGIPSLSHDGAPSRNHDWRRERVRELLLYLVLNPRTTRDRVAGTLWPELSGDKAAKNLRTTLTYLHHVLEPGRRGGDATWYVRVDGGEIRLHASLPVDLWQFRELVDQAEAEEAAGRPKSAMPLYVAAASLWNGDLMEGVDQSWLDLDRIHARSQFVRAACRGAELLLATGNPSESIELARAALTADAYNQRAFGVLADAYAGIGDQAAATSVRDMAKKSLED